MKSRVNAIVQMGLCVLCAWNAMSADVPQDSPAKYYFTTPKHPGGIIGKVIGNPPAYHAMRSEDLAWIREAAAERNTLARGRLDLFTPNVESYFPNARTLVPEFGKWPLSATNGFEKWTTAVTMDNGVLKTNVTARYSWKTNDMSGSMWEIKKENVIDGSAYFLPRSGDGTYAESIRRGNVEGWYLTKDANAWVDEAVHEEPPYAQAEGSDEYSWQGSGFVAVTNVTESVVTNWTGSYVDGNGVQRSSVRTNESYITMQMANGRTSVHTNRWVEILPREERTYTTNVMWQTEEAMMFADGIVVPYDPKEPESLEGPFRTSLVREWYEALSGAKRCAFNAWESTEDRSNVCNRVISKDGDELSSTNEYYNAWGGRSITGSNETEKNFVVKHEYQMTGINDFGEEIWEWVETATYIDTENLGGTDSVATPEQRRFTYRLLTDMLYDVVHTGGVERIDKAWAYAWTDVSWSRRWDVSTGDGNENEMGYTNKSCTVMMKLGEVQQKQGGREEVDTQAGSYWFGTTNRFVAFEANINVGNIYSRAITLAGMSFPTGQNFKPRLEKQCPEPTRENRSTGSYVTESYSVQGIRIVIVVDFKPWTSLQGW